MPDQRPPFEDDALDHAWDALVRNQQPSAQLPSDITETLRWLSSLDPAPQSNTVRERAWAETWRRIHNVPQHEEAPAMHTMTASSNHRLPQTMPLPGNARPAPAYAANHVRLTIAAALIGVSLLAIVAYWFFHPFDSDPDDIPVIPAVILQEATPRPIPVGEHKLAIDIPADMVHTEAGLNAGWDYIEVPPNRVYTYQGYCCPGPYIEYVLTGELTVQSDNSMTVYRANGTSETIPLGTETTLLPGDAFLIDNDGDLTAVNHGAEWTKLLGWVLAGDAFNGHDAGGFAPTRDVDLELGMTVNPGAGRVIITRYDVLEQIPDPAPNSYQFVMQAYEAPNGRLSVRSSLLDPVGTPVADGTVAGYYVLDFLMSPPATPSPVAATPAG